MKNIKSKAKLIVSLMIALLQMSVLVPVAAQPKLSTDNFLVWGSGGYSTIRNDAPGTKVAGNKGAAIGGGYEKHFGSFLIQSGLEVSYYSSTMSMNDTLLVLSMIDTEGDSYNGKFAFTNIKDKQEILNAGIPLMFGYESPDGIYFAIGGKVMFNMLGHSTAVTQVTSTAVYSNLIGDNNDGTLSNMPNHGLTTDTRTVKSSCRLHTIFSGSVEAGYTFGKDPENYAMNNNKPKVRLSLFCDYGFAPVTSKDKIDDIFVNNSKTGDVLPAIRGYLLHDISSNRLNILYAGLKVTILFGIRKHDCNCAW